MIALKYSIFALISIAFNLFFQYFTFLIYSGFLSIYLALTVGTLAGLVVKYILDKNFIFYYQTQTKRESSEKFLLYSLMGLFTTFIFWGFELGFDYLFESELAKYMGGFLGLTIGYVIKYFLDKRFVFRRRES